MKHKELLITYFHGDGLPLRRAKTCKPEAYNRLIQDVGSHKRTIRDTDPEQEMKATPLQAAFRGEFSQTVEFGNGCAKITTCYYPANPDIAPMPSDYMIVDEDNPGLLINPNKWVDETGQLEEYALAEFFYQEVDDNGGDQGKTPEPFIPPTNQLVRT